ncbi:hypothetical protein OS493_022595 [Desmophyllum pertusum]|uniref:Uncharacterized protein n=1 Tax=Desmophyllum pertusum TaxID=174260 RepID=A0A9W9Z278_9CNID|nr:hypothetical protein OS493_022595 [Desmophyllum pertusum]
MVSQESGDELKTITDVSVRELKVELEKGKVYEFVVTATNVHGESLIEVGKLKRVKTIGDIDGGGQQSHGTTGSSCDKEKHILHTVLRQSYHPFADN